MINSKKINVLIVDDSPTLREYLQYIINTDKELSVIGTARNGKEAVEMVQMMRPDVVTMDIHMPQMDGYEATRKIMEIHPVPIVIISSKIPEHIENTFHAIKAGAVAVLEKPHGLNHPKYDYIAAKIVQTVKLMAEVKVVRRLTKHRKKRNAQVSSVSFAPHLKNEEIRDNLVPYVIPEKDDTPVLRPGSDIHIVAIGASTGGPPVIRTILSNLAKNFPVPILLVQHIASGFIKGMSEWLKKETDLPICIPIHGEQIKQGHIYFAPDDFHMGVSKDGMILLSSSSPEYSLRPSVSYLFRSVAKAYGDKAAGILLTGMGRDGSLELKELKDKGAVTIVQDKDSSVIYGMPGEAIKLDAASHVFTPEKIAEFLNIAMGKHI